VFAERLTAGRLANTPTTTSNPFDKLRTGLPGHHFGLDELAAATLVNLTLALNSLLRQRSQSGGRAGCGWHVSRTGPNFALVTVAGTPALSTFSRNAW
jgi:hypothetical protein